VVLAVGFSVMVWSVIYVAIDGAWARPDAAIPSRSTVELREQGARPPAPEPLDRP